MVSSVAVGEELVWAQAQVAWARVSVRAGRRFTKPLVISYDTHFLPLA